MKPSWIKIVAAAALLLAGARAQALSIRTLAGGVTPGALNGFGSHARFNYPGGVAVDGAGNVYVADTLNSIIRRIAADGGVSTLAGLAGEYGSSDGAEAAARFYGPQAIAADGAGQLYLADTVNSTIRKVTPAGEVSTLAGVPGDFNSFDGAGAAAQFHHPEGVAVDAGGNLYVADTWNHTIRKITPAGLVSTLAGLAGYCGSADGTNSKARFNRPTGLVVDGVTNLFVADTFNHTLRQISPAGKVTTVAGLPGVWGSADGANSAARFYLPQGIAITADGDLLVADSGNQTLRKVSPVGTNWVVSTVAGLPGLAGSVNGSDGHARFCFPAGLALDNAGCLYVADAANHLIRTTRVVPPTLQFAALEGQMVLCWPTSAEGFVLEQSPTVDALAAWSPATNGIAILGDSFICTNSPGAAAFYRLRFP